MIGITKKYQAIKQGFDFVEDADGDYRIIEFSADELTEGLEHRVIIEPLPVRESNTTISMEFEWQIKMGSKWGRFNGVNSNGKLKTYASKSEFVNLITSEVVTEEEAKTDGVFNEGYNTSYFQIMNFIPISGQGIINGLSPFADAFFEMYFNKTILPKYAI